MQASRPARATPRAAPSPGSLSTRERAEWNWITRRDLRPVIREGMICVPSARVPGLVYRLPLDGSRCSCPATRRCWHQDAADIAESFHAGDGLDGSLLRHWTFRDGRVVRR